MHALAVLLADHPDREYVNNLVGGVTNGFDTGISCRPDKTFECRNNKSARDDKQYVTEAIRQELASGFLKGPFEALPFSVYRVSPLGVAIHKYSFKKRLIVDLSAPHADSVPSLNSLINKEQYSLSYVTVDDAIKLLVKLGRFTVMSKFDIKSAFKILPISPDLFPYHCVHWEGYYYVYVRLCFGSTSSPKIFTELSKALHYIATKKYHVPHVLYLLDDFLCLTPPGQDAGMTHSNMLSMFGQLNIPLSEEKTVKAQTCLTFLGIELDSDAMMARLPADKKDRILGIVAKFLTFKVCSKHQLLQLLGHLAFASRIVYGARTFVSRLLTLIGGGGSLYTLVKLDRETKRDLAMWEYLLTNWNGVYMFIAADPVSTVDLQLFTDSSSSWGFGAFHKARGRFLCGSWSEHPLPKELGHSLSYLELYPICVAAIAWGSEWTGRRISFVSDNEGTVGIINKGRSRCEHINRLLRRLVITSTMFNFTFCSQWISTHKNVECDLLSRNSIASFQKLAPGAVQVPCPPQEDILF